MNKQTLKTLIKNGLKKMAAYLSRFTPIKEMEEAWEESENEIKPFDEQEKIWKAQQLSVKERMQVFLDSGVPEYEMNSHRQEFLQNEFEAKVRYLHENGIKERPKELNKIESEYWYKFEDTSGLTDHEIEIAREYPMEKLIKTKRGKACCPFHKEKTPSFSIHKNLYKCFGCNAGGDSIRFIMLTQNITFKETVKYLISL